MSFMKHTLVAASILALFACGGSGSSSTASTATAGSSTGVLTDSPIEGVEYVTSGGYQGLTDANGQYKYNPGETVTFKIGAITLGSVPATGTITPVELAGTGADASNKVTNLLVLLQSLDADGDPSTKISISAAARTAAASAGTVDLTAAPATFASTANTALVSLMSASGASKTTPVSPADALAHFKSQFMNQLKGGWLSRSDGKVIVFRFDGNGNYAHGETGAAAGGGHAGIELAQINWDPATAVISQVSESLNTAIDTNGEWGPSSLTGSEVARFEGENLVIADSSTDKTTFTRVPTDANNPIVGMWAVGSTTNMRTQTFVFFADGKYLMIDPLGDTEGNCSVVQGIEYGSYSFNASTGEFSMTQQPIHDTNGCAGLWDNGQGSSFNITFDATKTIATTSGGDTFYRITP